MTMAIKIVIRLTLTVVVIVLSVFSFIYFSPRPPLTIDPDTLAGDGSAINYCELPVLDGSGYDGRGQGLLPPSERACANTPQCQMGKHVATFKVPWVDSQGQWCSVLSQCLVWQHQRCVGSGHCPLFS